MPVPFSSLTELNKAFAGAYATYVQSTLAFPATRVVYNPTTDYDSDLIKIRRTSPKEDIAQLPCIVVSRTDLAREFSARTTAEKFTVAVPGVGGAETEELSSVDFRVVQAQYSARIYVETAEESGYLINQLMMLASPKAAFHYTMEEVAPGRQFLGVMRVRAPGIETKVVTRESSDREGQVYCVEMQVSVRASLVGAPFVRKTIQTIDFAVYELSGESTDDLQAEPILGKITF